MHFDFNTSMIQYRHHLQPVYDGLPEALRGSFTTSPHARNVREFRPGAIGVTAAVSDYRHMCERKEVATSRGHFTRYRPVVPAVLFEHGVGYSFHGSRNRNASYAGGIGRDLVSLLPSVNRYVAEANLTAYPEIPAPIVGCPKLDALIGVPAPTGQRPVVCISFHWDCRVAPETRWAFSWYRKALGQLVGREFDIIAHGHPRMAAFWAREYPRQGIEFVPRFEDVVARANVYVNDSSSTLYEFAATGRPVVVLNAPWYRRDVQHGLRFWEHADVGIQVDDPNDLLESIYETLASDPHAEQRAVAIEDVYPYLGRSVPRTVEVLTDLAEALA